MRTDDETWLGQLREIRVGEERAETDLEEGSQREHLRRVEHGGDHRRRPRHSLHHGPSRRIQARPGLDSREPRLRHREYTNSLLYPFSSNRTMEFKKYLEIVGQSFGTNLKRECIF